MNFNNNSSGIYDVTAFNLTAKNATIITSLNISGLTTLSSASTCLNSPGHRPTIVWSEIGTLAKFNGC